MFIRHLNPRHAKLRHYPLVAFATLATVIASQAIISGVFSLTQQAVQLGFLPRMHIKHTASHEIGQIYVPLVNWLLAAATLGAVIGFGTSDALAGAYGIAVSLLMAITTLLAALDEGWADPRRLYSEGRRARALLDQAREVIAHGLGVRPAEVSFLPSGPAALRTGR